LTDIYRPTSRTKKFESFVNFANFVNFFVREVGRGSDVLERSLEITEVLRGEEGDDEDRKPVCNAIVRLKFTTLVQGISHPILLYHTVDEWLSTVRGEGVLVPIIISWRNLDVVVETRQSFYEHVGSFVGELVTTGREEVQRLVEVKVKMSTMKGHITWSVRVSNDAFTRWLGGVVVRASDL